MKFLSRLSAITAIRFKEGRAVALKGKPMRSLLNDLSQLAEDSSLQKGEIWINALGKISFSKEIPPAVHQRIRNVILSH